MSFDHKSNCEFASLSNAELAQSLKLLIQKERQVLTEILWHLREVESRRLFAEAGYSSLFEYVVKELGYSESAAFRRISAMRLLKSLPASEVREIESAIQAGKLNLSKLTQAQGFFKSESKTADTKMKVLKDLEIKSVRECERYFAELSPAVVPVEKVRALTQDQTELKIIVSNGLMDKIKKFKDLQSHVKHDASIAEVLEMAFDIAIEKKDMSRKCNEKLKYKRAKKPLPAPEVKVNDVCEDSHDTKVIGSVRFIPINVKRMIWTRDQSKCTFKNPASGAICGSTYQVQIDHIQPVAMNGSNHPNNLRLLCRTHNLWRVKNANLGDRTVA